MKIELREIPIRDVVNGYVDNGEEGVFAYGGKLNIRPKYQREFIYDDDKQKSVIDTIKKGFPLNVMYWVVNDDGTFEVLDGQQRTISFCQYLCDDFSVDNGGYPMLFSSLTETEREKILNYKLMVYFCEGNDKEKLDWFKVINISGEKLFPQELRNAVYTGEWLTSAKTIFSKSTCAAYLLAKDYVGGSPIRQELLETALNWISKGDIENYMSAHQQDPNANELWIYFKNVIDWVQLTFPVYRKVMKGLDWGKLYDECGSNTYDTNKIEQEIKALLIDDDITSDKGVYYYVLTRNEKYLSVRAFSDAQKLEVYTKADGVCAKCGKKYELEEMHADHIKPWIKGGKTVLENCQLLCQACNATKSDKY